MAAQLQARVWDGDLVQLMCRWRTQVLRSGWPLYYMFFSSPLEAQQGPKLYITLMEANLVMAPLITSCLTLLSYSLGLFANFLPAFIPSGWGSHCGIDIWSNSGLSLEYERVTSV